MDKNQNYSCTSELGAEVLMVITSFIIASIAIYNFYIFLVPKNRNYRKKLSDKDADIFLSASYALFFPLMSYLFSQAKQKNPKGRAQLILVWMVLIEFIRVRGSDSTWELQKSAEQLVRLAWVVFLVYGYEPPDGLRAALLVLCALSFASEVLKGITFNKCKDSYLIGRNPELIHNYMKRVMLEDELKTTPMNNCDYIVMAEENHEIAVCENGYVLGDKKSNSEGKLTIGRVFQLNSSEGEAFILANPDWRDNCLSLALAKMLRRRFVNLPLDEAGNSKALEFVLDGLIDYIGNNKDIVTEGQSNIERNPVERVFGIIGDELKFISDFSHFKVPTSRYFNWHLWADLIGVSIMLVAIYYLPSTIGKRISRWLFLVEQDAYSHCYFHIFRHNAVVVNMFFDLDELITTLLAAACIYIQYKGTFELLTSHRWSNLLSVQRYFNNTAQWNKSHSSSAAYKSRKLHARLVNKIKKVFSSIKNVVHWIIRYSIPVTKVRTIFDIKVNGTILALLAKWARRNIGRAFPNVFLSSDVKETILRSLKTQLVSGGQLTNGETTLKRHGIWENLNPVNRPSGSTTEAIFVWHVATTLFHHQKFSPEPNNNPFFSIYRKVIISLIRYRLIPENLLPHEESPSQQNNDQFKKEREVAIALSSYCLYLVESLPHLLPDEVKWTEKLYKSVRGEIFAIDRSSGQKPTRKNRCNYAVGIGAGRGEYPVLKKGVEVAQMLVFYADSGKEAWTMLSEFWAEMMLFIAPSDNIKGHEEILEKEELITQLWALLSHAGIVTRSKPTQPPNHGTESIELTEVVIR